MAFAKHTPYRSAPGIAIYPKLNAPDTKFKPDGEYSVKMRLTQEDAQPLVEKIEEELLKKFEEEKATLTKAVAEAGPKDKAKAKTKLAGLKLSDNRPYADHMDDEGEETGDVVLKFNGNATIKGKDDKPDRKIKPDFFDAKGKSLKVVPEIWGGSKLAIAGVLQPYNTPAAGFGIKLRLDAVQIIELRQGGSRDAEGYGFGQEDGGYEGADESEASPFGGEGADTSNGDADAGAAADNF